MTRNPVDIPARMTRAMEKGLLSRADLATWFERPYSTIKSWLDWNRTPSEDWAVEIERRLVILETLVGKLPKHHALVPYHISRRNRHAFLRDLLNGRAQSRVSRKNTAA